LALIELAEGIVADVVGARNEALHIGMPLEPVLENVNDKISLPKLRKAGAASQAVGLRVRP
jgi:hypothetical protein